MSLSSNSRFYRQQSYEEVLACSINNNMGYLLYCSIYRRNLLNNWLKKHATEHVRSVWRDFEIELKGFFSCPSISPYNEKVSQEDMVEDTPVTLAEGMAVQQFAYLHSQELFTRRLLAKLKSYIGDEKFFTEIGGEIKTQLISFIQDFERLNLVKFEILGKHWPLSEAEQKHLEETNTAIIAVIPVLPLIINNSHLGVNPNPDFDLKVKTIKALLTHLRRHLSRSFVAQSTLEAEVAIMFTWNKWKAAIAQIVMEKQNNLLTLLLREQLDLQIIFMGSAEGLASTQRQFLRYLEKRKIKLPVPMADAELEKMKDRQKFAKRGYDAKVASIRESLLSWEVSLQQCYERGMAYFKFVSKWGHTAHEQALIHFLTGAQKLHMPCLLQAARMIYAGEGCVRDYGAAYMYASYVYVLAQDGETKRAAFALAKVAYHDYLIFNQNSMSQPAGVNLPKIVASKKLVEDILLDYREKLLAERQSIDQLVDAGRIHLALHQIQADFDKQSPAHDRRQRSVSFIPEACLYFSAAHAGSGVRQNEVKASILDEFNALLPSIHANVDRRFVIDFCYQLGTDLDLLNPPPVPMMPRKRGGGAAA